MLKITDYEIKSRTIPSHVLDLPRKPKFRYRKIPIFTCIFLVFVIVGYIFLTGKPTREEIPATPEVSKTDIVWKVGKLMVLPTNEQPIVAAVTDLEKLKGQEFFAEAKVGDYVLIYSKYRKAILYDPLQNKIVEVGPITLPSNP